MSSPAVSGMPGYFRDESSGIVLAVISDYINGFPLSEAAIAVLRSYFSQWVNSPVWKGGKELEQLRRDVEALTSYPEIDAWLERCMDLGMDPL